MAVVVAGWLAEATAVTPAATVRAPAAPKATMRAARRFLCLLMAEGMSFRGTRRSCLSWAREPRGTGCEPRVTGPWFRRGPSTLLPRTRLGPAMGGAEPSYRTAGTGQGSA
ncbi:hypothetical protein GCM10011578_013860 [Streptomyces fuscichromogenes]|uniref:Uncharacterized protein n=1 Tax=Streptomyces fuscichromogenes TaxID=1324013 RepID=A0A917UJF7_9ACTN|nr:hypothetical protein GCM10011578_013860 [Streptomyces fuscichromogenes]